MNPGKVDRLPVVDAQTGVQIIWTLMPGEIGPPQSIPQYKEKTVQIAGALEDGDVEGSNDPEGLGPWDSLMDNDTGEPLNAPGLYRVKLNPLWIQPVNRKSQGPVRFIIVATR